jgi:hypothetical protein
MFYVFPLGVMRRRASEGGKISTFSGAKTLPEKMPGVIPGIVLVTTMSSAFEPVTLLTAGVYRRREPRRDTAA